MTDSLQVSETQELPAYQYEPLKSTDSVRILVLDSAKTIDAPLRCSFIQLTRSASLAVYSAVSYTWGDQESSHRLICANKDPHKIDSRLNIKPNVDAFLRHFRKPHKQIYLWVDALCLNQQDGNEKGQQIKLMGQIYRSAKKVHVWLGADDGQAADTFALIRRMEASYKPNDREIRLITALFRLPWFHRRWIIQEIALAHRATFYWGQASLDSSWLMSVLKRFRTSFDAYGAEMFLATEQLSAKHQSLLTMLWQFDQSECTDPRDRIAALVGLTSSDDDFEIDYDTDDRDQYYRRVTARMIKRHRKFAELIMIHLFEFGSINQSLDSTPQKLSWVPNWAAQRRKHPFMEHSLVLGIHEQARASEQEDRQRNQAIKSVLASDPERYKLRGQDSSSSTPSHKQPRSLSDQYSAWGNDSKHYSEFTISATNGDVLEARWSETKGDMYGRVVDEVFKLAETQDQWQDTINVIRPLQEYFDDPKKIRETYSDITDVGEWRYSNYNRLCRLFEMFMRLRDPLQRGQMSRTESIKTAIRDAMKSSESLALEQVRVLTEIGTLLRHYTLLRLRPHCQDKKHTFEVALGPRDAKESDVLIPLLSSLKRGWSGIELMICVRPFSNLGPFKPNVSRRRQIAASWLPPKHFSPVVFTDPSNGQTYDEVPPRKAYIVGPAYCAVDEAAMEDRRNSAQRYWQERRKGMRPLIFHII